MSPESTKYPADRILGQKDGRLGIVEKETILENVLASSRAKRPGLMLPLGFAGAVGTAMLVLVIAYLNNKSPDDFGARGNNGSSIELSCNPRVPSPCKVGDRLYFRMLSLTQGTHLAAFAQTPDGDVVWFFPSADSEASRAVSVGVVDEAKILPDSLAGDVTVHVVLSETPLTRAQIRALYDRDAASHGAVRLERSLKVTR